MNTHNLYRSTGSTRARTMRRLMLTASAVVGLAGVAHAQDASGADPQTTAGNTAAPDDQATGDIVVTGYRQSIEASLAQKRNANAFVDVITAEDVGKFPDKNVADSLQRVPGVIIDRDGGEGARARPVARPARNASGTPRRARRSHRVPRSRGKQPAGATIV